MAARRRSRFVPARNLETAVARRILAPRVARVADAVALEARRTAPPSKTWLSMRDDDVRPAHVKADGQEIPANLRFVVGGDLLREPRDPHGAPELTINCRCEAPRDPDAIRRAITVVPVALTGSRARAVVRCDFPRIAEAEFGTPGDPPLRFMGRAARAASSRTR